MDLPAVVPTNNGHFWFKGRLQSHPILMIGLVALMSKI
jgi:hypothetical protein